MNVVLAGAFGKLGSDTLRALVAAGHTVTAADMVLREIPELADGYTAVEIDVTRPETLEGLCDGADVVISTVGLTGSSPTVTNYDIDYRGNLNLLNAAKAAGGGRFAYVSVLKADSDPKVPMLHAKALLEQELKQSGLGWVIFRPTGYFYDIAKVFMPMIEKGEVTLLGKEPVRANVIDTVDLGSFIALHMTDENRCYSIGGKETYTYEEIARMFFAAAGKEPVIKRAPVWLFSMLALMNRLRRTGREGVIRFSRWTLTNEMVGDTVYGEGSFQAYIQSCYAGRGE